MNVFEWPLDPELLFDAAREVRCYQLPLGGTTRYFVVFSRRCTITDENLSPKRGVMLALFESDTDGAVKDWTKRFESEGRNFDDAFWRFQYRFVNGFLQPIDVSRLPNIPDDERELLDAMMASDESDYQPDFDDSCP